jgi:nitronate monooxygenase
MKSILKPLKIGDLIAKLPIIQGGMGVGISLSRLAAAVANEGGIGIISSVGLGVLHPTLGLNYKEANIAALKEEIRAARKQTTGILGINIMVAISDFDEMIRAAFEEEIDIVFLGAGLPIKVPSTMTLEYLQNTRTKIGIIVSSGRAAKLILNHWAEHFQRIPDIVVVEGPKAGGHLGFKRDQIFNEDYALEVILPQVKTEVDAIETKYGKSIPVIAAGGIFSGEQMYKIMALGADGVQLGTRFVATEECDAGDAFKQLFVDCKQEEIVIIDSPVGLPGRAIGNQFLKDVSQGIKKPFLCPWKCLKTCDYRNSPYCIAMALQNARIGKFAEGFAFAGANAYLVKNITTVKELIRNLLQEYQFYYNELVNKGKLKLAAVRNQ